MLALDLHLSIGQLEEMPNAEYLQWRAFYLYRQEMERLAKGASEQWMT